jgi:hypothetical protein
MRTFIRQFLPAFLVTAAPLFLAAWVTHLLNWPRIDGVASLVPLAPLYLAYLIPIGLLLHGIRFRNDPMTAGVIAGCAAFWLSAGWSLQMQRRAIAAVTLVAAPQPPSSFLILDTRTCDALCVQILATSDYQVALKRHSDWLIYRRGEGSACATSLATTALFLSAGYPDTCALEEQRKASPDGIVINEHEFAGKGLPRKGTFPSDRRKSGLEYRWDNPTIEEIARQVPAFVGTLIEGAIRADGKDELVERRFIGRLESATELMTLSLAPGPLDVGRAPDRAAIYSRLLGLDLDPASRSGPLPLSEILDRLEALMLAAAPPESSVPSDDLRRSMTRRFGALAHAAEGDAISSAARIQRLLKSDKPVLVYAALNSMAEPHDMNLVKPALTALIDGDNPDIVAIAARRADEQFGLRDDPEIRKRVVEIPFRTELFQRESELTPMPPGSPSKRESRFEVVSLPGQNRGRSVTHEHSYRRRAVSLLTAAPNLIPGHCDLLLRIVSRGEDAERSEREAFEALLATQPDTFVACMQRLKSQHHRLFRELAPSDQQVLILRDRAALLPSDALFGYWQRFLSKPDARKLSDIRLLAIVAERLAEDERSRTLEKRAREQLLYLRSRLLNQ